MENIEQNKAKYNDKIIKTLFYRDVEPLFNFDILRSETTEINNGLDKNSLIKKSDLEKLYKSHYQEFYESEEIEYMYEYYFQETQDHITNGVSPQILDLCFFLIKPFFTKSNEIRINMFMDWYGMYSKVTEDILYIIYISNTCNSFSAEYICNVPLEQDFIKDVLSTKKSENHMHLKASTVLYPFNYYCIIIKSISIAQFNSKIARYINSRRFENEQNKLFIKNAFYKVKVLRIYFSKLLASGVNEDVCDLNKLLNILDYKGNQISVKLNEELKFFFMNQSSTEFDEKAEFNSYNDLISFLNIERKFIYKIIKLANKTSNNKIKDLAYLYLYYSNQVNSIFQMNNKNSNFDEFLKVQDYKDAFITPIMEKRYLESVVFTYDYDNATQIEYRTVPYEIKKYINVNNILQKACLKSKNNIKIINVSHIIKKPILTIKELNSELKKIQKLADSTKVTNFAGIDAANNELSCFAEKFGWVYRYFNDRTKKEFIGKTFHVAEVYISILNGIRRVDDAIHYLNLSSGDRLGHAIGIGTSVKKFYEKRMNIFQIKEHYLTDIIWLYNLLKKEYNDPAFISVLEKEIEREIADLNSLTYFDGIIVTKESFYNYTILRSDYILGNKQLYTQNYSDLNEYLKKFKSESYKFNVKDFRYKEAFNDKLACDLLWYLSEFESKHKYTQYKNVQNFLNKKVLVSYSEDHIKAISFAQDRIIEKIYKKQIAIESNLSSNYLITEIERFDEHPIFRLNSRMLNEGDLNLKVCINTDDSGLFRTTINQEYRILAMALKTSNTLKISDDQIIKYVKYLIEQSNNISWINHES